MSPDPPHLNFFGGQNNKKIFLKNLFFYKYFFKICTQTGMTWQKIVINKKGVSGHAEYLLTFLCAKKIVFFSLRGVDMSPKSRVLFCSPIMMDPMFGMLDPYVKYNFVIERI